MSSKKKSTPVKISTSTVCRCHGNKGANHSEGGRLEDRRAVKLCIFYLNLCNIQLRVLFPCDVMI